jgi:cell wall-associated NlpC family hydrolase
MALQPHARPGGRQSVPVRPGMRRRATHVGVAAILTTIGLATVAVPVTQAAPATATGANRARIADPIADRAGQALLLLKRFEATGDPLALQGFESARDEIAAAVAQRLGLQPADMQAAWARADHPHQTAVIAALGQLGVAYRRNTSRPGVSFDCSGLTSYAWAQAGVQLTRQSSAQIRNAAPRDPQTAQAGDLVQYPGHVMIWLGVERAVVHAVMPGRPVEVLLINERRSLRWGDPTG